VEGGGDAEGRGDAVGGGGRGAEVERGGGQGGQRKGPEEAVGSEFINLFDICRKLIDSRCCGKRRRQKRLGGWTSMG